MKITRDDIGKRFFLDGQRSAEVTLYEIDPDGVGFRIQKADGSRVPVIEKRLTRITEIPASEYLGKLADEILEYPVKPVRVEVEFVNEKGEREIKFLDGGDAVLWSKWMRVICYKAEQLGENPPFYKLGWRKKKVKQAE